LGNDRLALLMDRSGEARDVAADLSDLLTRFPPDASFHDSVWDQAAGPLLIEEAGGRVTDWRPTARLRRRAPLAWQR
jgi:3'-phosphoadenosine 5'-phosphosulfate (PAPS) 3'-phosphatase